jgi:hypothetical protein
MDPASHCHRRESTKTDALDYFEAPLGTVELRNTKAVALAA